MKKMLIFTAFLMVSVSLFSQDNKKNKEEDSYFALLSDVTVVDSLIGEQLKSVGLISKSRDSLVNVFNKTTDSKDYHVFSPNEIQELLSYVKMTDSVLLVALKICIININDHVKYFDSKKINKGSKYWGTDVSASLLRTNDALIKTNDALVVYMNMIKQDLDNFNK